MKQRTSIRSRLLAMLMAMVMVMSLLPMAAFAAGGGTTYTKADSLEVGKEYLIVAASSSGKYYALTNGSNLKTQVTVSGDEVDLGETTDANLLWTVGTATETQTQGGALTFTNGTTMLARTTKTNAVSLNSSDTNTKYFGHDFEAGTISKL